MKNNIDNYLKFISTTLESIRYFSKSGLLKSLSSGEIDITSKLPSLSKLKEFDIELTTVPFYIDSTTQKDLMTKEFVEIDELDKSIKDYKLLYSITVAIKPSSSMYENDYRLIVRGVKK